MKVLLINPPKSPVNLIAQYAPEDMKRKIEKIGLVGPPHSLCSIAGNLRDFEVEILDLKAEYDLGLNMGLDQFMMKKLGEFSPDIVGVTVITSDYNGAISVLKSVKQFDPKILTIVGGIHPSLCPEDFNLPYVDIAVQGPGKKIFRDIAVAHKNKYEFSSIPNIVLKREGGLFYTKRLDIYGDKEHLLSHVHANRKLVKKYDDAYRAGADHRPVAFVETSLGCPSRCSFCAIWPMNRGNYYIRSIDDIISELKTMDDYEVIRFVDANTMGDVNHCSSLFDRIIREQLNKTFIMDIRADTAVHHPELIEKASAAGLKVAIVGIESDNDEELQFYNKESSKDITLKSIEIFQKYDIDVRGICMVQPDYTEKDFQRINNFVSENGLTHSAFTVMTPIPGTPLYSRMKHKIAIKDMDYYNYFNSVFETKLPEEEFYMRTAELFRDKQVRY